MDALCYEGAHGAPIGVARSEHRPIAQAERVADPFVADRIAVLGTLSETALERGFLGADISRILLPCWNALRHERVQQANIGMARSVVSAFKVWQGAFAEVVPANPRRTDL